MTDMAVMVLFVDIPVMGVNRLILRPVLTLEEQGERHLDYTIDKKNQRGALFATERSMSFGGKGRRVTPIIVSEKPAYGKCIIARRISGVITPHSIRF